jgi:Tfp pilus assembly protein PilN
VRPVNLIPPENRRGHHGPLRAGPLSYVIVAVLAVALLGVTLVVTTNNKISDRKAEKASLEAELAEAQAQAERLRPFTDFVALQRARQDTVTSLATSRFDWERVLRELAIVIPSDVWLTSLDASASAETSASTSSTSSASTVAEGIEGPSLDIQGCASGHEAVARFLAALRDIDGVTRVTVTSSARQESSSSTSSTSTAPSSGATAGSCATRDFISTFSIVAAFDAAQPALLEASSTPSTTVTSGEKSQVADGREQLQEQKDAAAEKTQSGHKAVDTFIPGAGSAP